MSAHAVVPARDQPPLPRAQLILTDPPQDERIDLDVVPRLTEEVRKIRSA